MKKVSVVMPSYNTRNLYKNVLEVKNELVKFTKKYEIIIVNDGSTKFWEIEIKNLKKVKGKWLRIISYEKNMGKGYALIKGGLAAKGDVVVFIDADLDIPAKLIKDYVEKISEGDIVIGSKRHPLSKLDYPILRRFMSFWYQRLIALLFGLNVKDTQVGIKAFKIEVLKKVLPKLIIKGFAFDLELLVVANKYHYKIIEAPVEIKFKFASTIKSKAVFDMLIDTAAIFYRLKILRYYDQNE